jgi:hypothetical protein
MSSREEIKKNLADFVGPSSERMRLLKAVRKPHHYTEAADKADVYPTTSSEWLKAMVPLGLVEEVGRHEGIYRQSAIVRGLSIDSVIKSSSRSPRGGVSAPSTHRAVRKIKVKVPDIEGILDGLDVERVIQKNCFPLRKPYRMYVGEAYLQLENAVKDELGIIHSRNMMDVIDQARAKKLFGRTDPGEEAGLNQLFNASATWMRNPLHHKKEDIPRQDALKMILFADYLIKLVRRQKKLNGIR